MRGGRDPEGGGGGMYVAWVGHLLRRGGETEEAEQGGVA